MTVRIRLKRQKRRSSFLKSGCSCGGFEAVLRKRTKKKSPENRLVTGLFGGELGIRTLEAFRLTAFRVLHLRPLGQLSVYVIPFSFEKLFARTDGKNNKIFNFRTEQKLSIYGDFEGSILPNSQKISSAAPSTTRTTLRVSVCCDMPDCTSQRVLYQTFLYLSIKINTKSSTFCMC